MQQLPLNTYSGAIFKRSTLTGRMLIVMVPHMFLNILFHPARGWGIKQSEGLSTNDLQELSNTWSHVVHATKARQKENRGVLDISNRMEWQKSPDESVDPQTLYTSWVHSEWNGSSQTGWTMLFGICFSPKQHVGGSIISIECSVMVLVCPGCEARPLVNKAFGRSRPLISTNISIS